MARNINCGNCGAFLGEIRDAKLRKGLAHYCEDCDRRQRSALRMAQASKASRPFGGVFADVFGSKWGE